MDTEDVPNGAVGEFTKTEVSAVDSVGEDTKIECSMVEYVGEDNKKESSLAGSFQEDEEKGSSLVQGLKLYGCWNFRPRGLQCMNTTGWFLFWYSWAGFAQSMCASGLIGVSLSSLEKQFDLRSTESGKIMSTYEFVSIPVLLLLGTVGPVAHEPVWVACGMLFLCSGALLYTVPQWVTGLYVYGGAVGDQNMCVDDRNGTGVCDGEEGGSTSLSSYLYVFICAAALISFGAMPLYTLGVAYLDKHVTPKTSAIYFGIFYAMTSVGPALALIGGGALLLIYVDFYAVDMDTIDITPSDPRWVGAWWIGFLIVAVLCLLDFLPILGYNRKLPLEEGVETVKEEDPKEEDSKEKDSKEEDSKEKDSKEEDSKEKDSKEVDSKEKDSKEEDSKEKDSKEEDSKEKDSKEEDSKEKEPNGETPKSTSKFKQTIKDLPGIMKALGINLPYVFTVIQSIGDGLLITGFAVFGPKYLENQFSMSAGAAGGLFGIVVVPGAAGGTILGGWLIKVFKMSLRTMTMNMFLTHVFVILLGSMFFIQCDNPAFAGVTTTVGNSTADDNLTAVCNVNCDCARQAYEPICGIDHVIYFSPCYAGCTEEFENGDTLYRSCQCIYENVYETRNLWNSTAVPSVCSSPDCDLMPLFMVMFMIAMLIMFVGGMLQLQIILRSVAPAHIPMALGVQSIVARLLGTMNGPLLFGAALDGSCLLWEEKCDGSTGNCLFYDNHSMAYHLLAVCCGCKLFSSIFSFAAWRCQVYKENKAVKKEAARTKDETTDEENKASAICEDPALDEDKEKYLSSDNKSETNPEKLSDSENVSGTETNLAELKLDTETNEPGGASEMPGEDNLGFVPPLQSVHIIDEHQSDSEDMTTQL